MIKFVALYRVPADSEAFDRAYFQTHLPLLASTPGLQRTEVARVTRTLLGEPAYYLLAELYFADADALRAALKSPQWAASGENLQSFGGMDLATMFTAEVVEPAAPTGSLGRRRQERRGGPGSPAPRPDAGVELAVATWAARAMWPGVGEVVPGRR